MFVRAYYSLWWFILRRCGPRARRMGAIGFVDNRMVGYSPLFSIFSCLHTDSDVRDLNGLISNISLLLVGRTGSGKSRARHRLIMDVLYAGSHFCIFCFAMRDSDTVDI